MDRNMFYIFIFLFYLVFCVAMFLIARKFMAKRSQKVINRSFNGKKSAHISKNPVKFFSKFVKKIGYLFSRFTSSSFEKRYAYIINTLGSSKTVLDFNAILGYKVLSSLITGLVVATVLKKIYFVIPGFLCSCMIGFFIPDFFLRRAVNKKMEEFEFELPYTIDLIYIATLSGQNIYNSLKVLTEKYQSSVSIELSRFLKEIKFGVGRAVAFRNALNRNKTDSFKNLLFLLIQAEKFGSKISEVLRQKSRYMRFELIQKCEMRSRRVSILLLFPLVFLILPAFVLLVGGPLVYSIAGSFVIS